MCELKIKTVENLVEFASLTKTDQATYFSKQLKDIVFVTNKNSYFVFDDTKKLFLEQNEGQYYTYFCDYINNFVKFMKSLYSKIKCICDDDSGQCDCGAKSKRKVVKKLIEDFDTKTFLKDISERSYGKLYDTEFDKKINIVHNMLPIQNGKIIDLKTLEIRDRTINDKFTFECPVSFIKDGNTKHAEKFFCDVMPDEKERIFLQKCLGYMLTGEIDARAFFIWYGNGSNGKSVITNLLMKILHHYYVAADKSVFCKTDSKNAGAASPHLYALLGKRMIGYSEGETADQFELNFSVLKQISGDDEIACRGLYKDQITFKSCGKLNFLTNYVPRLSSEDALKNRTRLICFGQEFVESPTGSQKRKDTQFTDNLESIYLDEVFTWIACGSKMYYQDRKLMMPDSFQQQTMKFMNQEDSIESFFNNRILFTKDNKDSMRKNELFNTYQEYCKENSQRCQPRSTMFNRLNHKKLETSKLHGYDVYRGIKLVSVDEDAVADPIDDGIDKKEQSICQESLEKVDLLQQIKYHEEQLKQLYQQHLNQSNEPFKVNLKPKTKSVLTKRIIPVSNCTEPKQIPVWTYLKKLNDFLSKPSDNAHITAVDDDASDFDLDGYFN